jgi:alkylation response protein AidB-like acyl-CoA dehydrogenase
MDLTGRRQTGTIRIMLRRTMFDDEHELFRDAVRSFVEREIVPNADKWEQAGVVDKSMFRTAGEAGFLAMEIPESFGGGGVDDFRFNVVVNEEIQRAGVMASGMCITLHNDVCLPYFTELADDEQKARWFPGLASGELMTAIAMTEPGAGSDLAGMKATAIADGDSYVLNGSKTFITNGINSDLVIVAAKTDLSQSHRGISLLVVEDGMAGFKRGRNLDKVGMHAQDTAELFFEDVRVPSENLLGGEGQGFFQLVDNLPRERLSLAISALAHAQAAFGWTVEYCRDRQAFGRPIGSFQNSKFTLAEMKTELDIGQVFLDRQVEAYLAGELTADDAAEAKWWCTDLEFRVMDQCLQLFGGYGYMEEYPIARAWRDARVQRIYGGTNEIMKEIVGRSLGF